MQTEYRRSPPGAEHEGKAVRPRLFPLFPQGRSAWSAVDPNPRPSSSKEFLSLPVDPPAYRSQLSFNLSNHTRLQKQVFRFYATQDHFPNGFSNGHPQVWRCSLCTLGGWWGWARCRSSKETDMDARCKIKGRHQSPGLACRNLLK